MKRYLLILTILLSTSSVFGHQPNLSSTMLIEQKDGSWLLQVASSLTAFETEIHTCYGEKSYATADEFRDLVLRHLREHISIVFDQFSSLTLEKGFVSLGHETKVVFQVSGVPDSFTKISVKNDFFKTTFNNQNAFMFLKNGFEKAKFVLNNDNNHAIELEAIENSFAQIEQKKD